MNLINKVVLKKLIIYYIIVISKDLKRRGGFYEIINYRG